LSTNAKTSGGRFGLTLYAEGVCMKSSLGCRDFGDYSCSFEAKSENKPEVIDAMLGHTTKYHAEKIANLSEKEKTDLIARMEQKIR
jgi:predicted small metal-binding protein